MGAAASYPSTSGASYDSLDKQGRITFGDDADTIEIVQRFKKKTGVDLFTLKGTEFASTVNALMTGRQIAGNFKATPSKYSFYHTLRTKTRGIDETSSNYAYDYFFKDPETPAEKAKAVEAAQEAAKVGAVAKEAKVNGAEPSLQSSDQSKDQSFIEWVMSLVDGSSTATDKDTSADKGTNATKPEAASLSSLSGITSAASNFASSGASATSAGVTPANPVPNMTSFQTNASNIVQPTSSTAVGSAPPPPQPPPQAPAQTPAPASLPPTTS